MMTRTASRTALAALALTGLLSLAGCGGGGTSSDTTGAGTAGDITIDGAWARTSAEGSTTGAAYMTITSADGDTLVGVKVDPSVAAMAQIHEIAMVGGSMSTDSTMMPSASTAAPEMKMQEVDEIELPAGKAVELKPGGYHIMLMQLAAPLTAGSTIDVTLVFGKAGEKTVTVPVQDDAE